MIAPQSGNARFCIRCGRERLPAARFCVGCGFEFSDPGIPAPPLQVATEPGPERPYPIRFRVPSSPPSRGTNRTRLILAFPFHVGPLAVVIVALVVAANSWHTRVAAWLGLVVLILCVPVLVLWLLAMALSLVVSVPAWLAALMLGRVPAPLHRFQAAMLRYVTRTSAYLCMAGGRWPPFPWQGADASPRVEIDPPAPRSRLKTLFVLPLALPAVITAVFFGVVVWMLGVGAWIAVAVTGRLPSTIAEMLDLSIGFQCRTLGYFPLLLTDVYPWYESGPLMLPARRADPGV
ncbi:MAG: hypothetical protein QOJ31_16 [Gaiellales bacterium]|nr:hypothetical protein [Gaiellales bacterium]